MQFFKTIFFFLLVCSYLCEAIVNGSNVPEGTLKLIIKTYIEDLITSTDAIDEIIKEKLLSLGDHIVSHPALHQTHFHVGTEAPSHELSQLDKASKKSDTLIVKRQNHQVDQPDERNKIMQQENESKEQPSSDYPSDEICKTVRQWESINTTHDFYENTVDVIHKNGLKQFIYTYRCAKSKDSCTGISPFFHSECTERHGWVFMYHKKRDDDRPKWGYIAIPHHCACKIQQRFGQTTSSTKKRKR